MRKWLAILLMMLLLSTASYAHRLNEYLQATTISLSHDKVSLQLRLTPGVDVAAKLLQDIDPDHDNQFSAAEQQTYLDALNRDLSLQVDGKSVVLNAVSYTFPTVADMKKGIGDIFIEYDAAIQKPGSFHRFKFENRHFKTIAVYLVNCLLPADTTIYVVSQTRSADQSNYQLNFTTGKVTTVTMADQRSIDKSDHQAVIKTYFIHGIKHILTGYDHLLFICALALGAASLWDLVKIVTAFTIAHSITLTLATFGIAHLPAQIVEPLIAASIVFVAVQNIFWPKYANGYSRLAIAFFFGLFHGLGFAGGLLELMHAMPTSLIVYAILGFSLGVETGNQIVLLPLYFAIQLLKSKQKTRQRKLQLPFIRYASALVAIAGMYYLCIDLWASFS